MSTKSAAVRKLLADLGSAFGKLFKCREVDHDDGDRADGDQAELSTAAAMMVFVAILIFGIVIVRWYIVNWEEVTVEVTEAYDVYEEDVEPAFEALREALTEAIREALVDCEKLRAELVVDFECVLSDNCMMTRDESVRSQERQDAHKKYCAE